MSILFSFFGRGIAVSNLNAETKPTIEVRDMNNANIPKSSSLYKREIMGRRMKIKH